MDMVFKYKMYGVYKNPEFKTLSWYSSPSGYLLIDFLFWCFVFKK